MDTKDEQIALLEAQIQELTILVTCLQSRILVLESTQPKVEVDFKLTDLYKSPYT